MIIIITAEQAAQPNNNPTNFPVGKGDGDGVDVEFESERAAIKNNENNILI